MEIPDKEDRGPAMRCSRLFICLFALAVANASAGVIFFDNFNAGASPDWVPVSGPWSASGGVYDGPAMSLLPSFSYLTDLTVQVDLTTGVGAGGIWLRAAAVPGSAYGVAGVLLVIRDEADIYWHVTTDGNTLSGPFSYVNMYGMSVPHTVKVTVVGNEYAAYLDGSSSPITTFTNSTFSSGEAGLYDTNSPMGFDNFSLSDDSIPEPGTAALMMAGVAALIVSKRRQR
jgi:hypothetical protein